MWSGPYAGGSLGYGALNNGVSSFDSGDGCTTVCGTQTNRSSGILGGAQFGYNWQWNSAVFGFETDISGASVSGSLTNGDYSQHSQLTALATIRGRFGFAFDQSLIFATGGWATGRVNNSVTDTGYPASWNSSRWRNGWTAGGGIERFASNGWSVKAEALYYRLNDQSTLFHDPGDGYSTPSADYPVKFRNDGVLARIGLSYHFGAPAGPVEQRY